MLLFLLQTVPVRALALLEAEEAGLRSPRQCMQVLLLVRVLLLLVLLALLP